MSQTDIVDDHIDANELSSSVRTSMTAQEENERACPSCELLTLKGMPGGRDAVCTNCGYKDPCCYD